LDPGFDRFFLHFDAVPGFASSERKPAAAGQAGHYVVVYLSRGNVLMGVYFPSPDGPQASVDGRTTVAGIVDVFAKRLAALPPAGLTASAPAGVGPTA
jgi:hypothetical protein